MKNCMLGLVFSVQSTKWDPIYWHKFDPKIDSFFKYAIRSKALLIDLHTWSTKWYPIHWVHQVCRPINCAVDLLAYLKNKSNLGSTKYHPIYWVDQMWFYLVAFNQVADGPFISQLFHLYDISSIWSHIKFVFSLSHLFDNLFHQLAFHELDVLSTWQNGLAA
jgi:hypothetical protein